MGSAELRPFRASTFHHTTSKVERGEAQQPTTGRFRQSRRRICRAEIRRTEGVEASALCRETRNTQDNNYYHLRTTQRAFMQRVQRCTVLRVRAGAGEWRGPWQRRRESFRILARSAEGRGRSTGPVARPDSTLLSVLPFMDNTISLTIHSWTIVSVTAVTFTPRSVHSRAADPDTLHLGSVLWTRLRQFDQFDQFGRGRCLCIRHTPRSSLSLTRLPTGINAGGGIEAKNVRQIRAFGATEGKSR